MIPPYAPAIDAILEEEIIEEKIKIEQAKQKEKEIKMTKLSISEMHEYAHKLFDCFNELEFRTTFNKALQAFYLEEGLYVVRSKSMGKYQYTLVEASSEEMAIRKCM